MNRNSTYYQQAKLLLQVIPSVSMRECFALKGGTAINLFVRDMPRLSVDIDLVFLPLQDRKEALETIRLELSEIKSDILRTVKGASVVNSSEGKADALRLVVAAGGVQIKVELSPVLRGTVFEPKVMSVSEKVEDEFGFAQTKVVSIPDLYAGKICAALDRQHPRDLFDVKLLFENEGITEEIRKAFIVYMLSHNRPISEIISPNIQDISEPYKNEFQGMLDSPPSLEELEDTRSNLFKEIRASLTGDERRFLLSFKNRSPEWSLLGLDGIGDLPAVRWKMQNLSKMDDKKHQEAYARLKEVLDFPMEMPELSHVKGKDEAQRPH